MPYLRRDFAFTVAATAKGEATVISTSTKTISKPNMTCLAFSEFSVKQDKNGALRGQLAITLSDVLIPERLQERGMDSNNVSSGQTIHWDY